MDKPLPVFAWGELESEVLIKMAFAIFKLSYNKPGETELVGGICGTGFFIDRSTAITAYHILNEDTFQPNPGFKHCQVWILAEGQAIIPLKKQFIRGHPEIDVTTIRLQKRCSRIKQYTLSNREPSLMTKVSARGYASEVVPEIKGDWHQDLFVLRNVNLQAARLERQGYIVARRILSVRARDIRVTNVPGLELSFDSKIGMSGGLVIDMKTNEVLGMLSIGLPPDLPVKTRTFAISVSEIRRQVQGIG